MAHIDGEQTAGGLRSRRLSRGPITFVLAVAVVLAIGFGVNALLAPPAAQPVPKRSEHTIFVPTPQQLLNLVIKPVVSMTFRSETVTDGYIAIDDDLSTPVFSPFSGRVTQILAKLGDHVPKGQALMRVEASEFVQAQSELITAKAQYNLAVTNEQRQHGLYEAEGAALRDWQQSQVDLAAAQATLSAARNRLRIFGKSEKEVAELEVSAKVPAMNPESVVAAPISGTVVQRQVGLGQFIQAGSSAPVFSIGDLSKVWLIANVREVDGSLVHLGEPVEIRVLAFPDRIFKATITYVAPSMDPNTHRLAVRADVDNREGLLKPQMFANFTILTGADVVAAGIPQSAVVYEGDTARVWVATPEGSLVLRLVQTGRASGDAVEVTMGLNPGERIVVSGALFIDRAATNQ
jgi:cobalt-zinc-cadmium efflux system membrane fusion protein